jgi:hypothetical protein
LWLGKRAGASASFLDVAFSPSVYLKVPATGLKAGAPHHSSFLLRTPASRASRNFSWQLTFGNSCAEAITLALPPDEDAALVTLARALRRAGQPSASGRQHAGGGDNDRDR